MTVLAIDPGSEKSAMLVWDGRRVILHAIMTNPEMLIVLNEPELKPDFVACEIIQSYGMAVGQEVFETCYWIGRFMERCDRAGKMFIRIKRTEVKQHICNDPKAKDPNIRQALIDRFGPIGKKKDPGPLYGIASHAWSALAIAATAHDQGERILASIPRPAKPAIVTMDLP